LIVVFSTSIAKVAALFLSISVTGAPVSIIKAARLLLMDGREKVITETSLQFDADNSLAGEKSGKTAAGFLRLTRKGHQRIIANALPNKCVTDGV
jgi:hypothetical protein